MKFKLAILSLAILLACSLISPHCAFSQGEGRDFSEVFGKNKNTEDPLYIKSETLSLDAESRTFTYKGNVKVKRGEMEITADRVVGKYNDKNEIETVVCEDNIVITKGESMRANANRAIYQVDQSKIILSEAPELSRDGNLLLADKITIYVKEDRSEAEGNVRVKVIREENGSDTKSLFKKKSLAGSEGA